MKKKIDPKYIAAFCVLAGTIIFYFLVKNLSVIFGGISAVLKVFSPVFYGFVFAYILNPLQKLIIKLFKKSKMKDKTKKTISVILSFVVALLIIGLVVLLVSTQVVQSVKMLIENSENYISSFGELVDKTSNSINELALNHPAIANQVTTALNSFKSFVSNIASNIGLIFEGAISFVNSTATVIGYVSLGLILSVYMLINKEKYIAAIKKLLFALFGENKATKTIEFGRELDDTVGGFFSGKILGSFIAGVLAYIAFLICRINFPALLALIIGICDIIPIFGPIIGAIPCGFILLVVAPKQVIPFIICLVVIEQLEGNIISPRILSRTTGVSGFWVLIALAVGGAWFGIIGMVLAVPIFAMIQKIFTRLINSLLKKKELCEDIEYYEALIPNDSSVENEPPKIVKFIKEKKSKKKTK